MSLSQVAAAPMPIRMPSAASVRECITQIAAQVSGRDPSHFDSLLGPVVPTQASLRSRQSDWRLAFYHGSPADNEVIQRAITHVQRSHPFIDID
jgi:hypothetical protein